MPRPPGDREYLFILCEQCGEREMLAKDKSGPGVGHWASRVDHDALERFLLFHGHHPLTIVGEDASDRVGASRWVEWSMQIKTPAPDPYGIKIENVE